MTGMFITRRQKHRWLCHRYLPSILLPIFFALGVLLSHPLGAATQPTLDAVDINTLPGGGLQLLFRLSEPATVPRSFTINEPARIVLDFLNTHNGLSVRQRAIESGVAEKITVLEGDDRTRASVNLSRLVPYTVTAQGNTVLLNLDAGALAPTRTPISSAEPAVPRRLENVDFRRGPLGEAIIQIKLSDASIPADVRQEGNQIIADFSGANLVRGQQRRLDVTDFATPVTLVDAMNRGNDARIVLQPTGTYEYLAYQADELYTIEVKPVQEEEQEDEFNPRKQKTYTGDLLSLNFQDIEVRAVLQILADFTGQNVVVSDSVKGNLTLRLQNVPWDQALDIILRTKGLTMRQSGNVMYIAPTEEVAAREKLELEARKTVEELVPLRTELIQVNYAKAKDLADLLKQSQGEATSSLMSSRGQVSVDERTNTLLVQDTPDKLSEIRNLVTRLDVPVRQVLIESRIVIATDSFSKELGIRWGFSGVRERDGGIITTTGSLAGTDGIVNNAIQNIQNTGQPFPVTVPNLTDRLGVNLGTEKNPFGRIALALLGKDYLVDLELSALQAEGQGEILSNPRVITADRAEASIKQGFEVPYVTPATANNPATVQFKEALLSLQVTPQITPDGNIIMDLKINRDDPDFANTVEGNPALNRREIISQVLVGNGQTIVLGGVFERNSNNRVDKVPLLGDLPGIGRLFQRRINADDKRELLIFVTPQIIKENIAAR